MEGRSDWGRYDFGTFQRRDVLTMGRFDCKALTGSDSDSFFIMAALRNRAGHYICALWFLSSICLSSFFSSHNLSGRKLDVYHTLTHGVALVRI